MDWERRWNSIPIGKENAVGYRKLMALWGVKERGVRSALRYLSLHGPMDGTVLIRSSHGRGFYRTADPSEMIRYRRECLMRARRILLSLDAVDSALEDADGHRPAEPMRNRLRAARESKALTVKSVAVRMRFAGIPRFYGADLWRMEEGLCMPTPAQLMALARIYMMRPEDLLAIPPEALEAYRGKDLEDAPDAPDRED